MKELIEEAVTNFWGNRFYEGVVNGKKHLATISGKRIVLSSKELLSKEPAKYYSDEKTVLYITEYSINELEDLFRSTLTARYRGHEFCVGKVGIGLENIELLSNAALQYTEERRYTAEQDRTERELGFSYDHNLGGPSKKVTLSELDDLIVTRVSVYETMKARICGET